MKENNMSLITKQNIEITDKQMVIKSLPDYEIVINLEDSNETVTIHSDRNITLLKSQPLD